MSNNLFKDWLLGLATANTPATGDYVPIVQNGVTKKADASGLGSGSGGGSTTFAGLVDVAIASPVAWDVPRYDDVSGRFINDQLDDNPTISSLVSSNATLVSQVAGLGALGGVIYETHSTTTVTNTTTTASLKSSAANPAIPIAEGDTIIGSFAGGLINTSGVSHTILPLFKLGANNTHSDDSAFPMTITSNAGKTRSWIFQFEVRVGSTSTNHRQWSAWYLTVPAGTGASTTSASGAWAPSETGWPYIAGPNVSSTADIGSTMPLIDLRVAFDVALTTLSMSCHFAQISLIKKP